MGGVFLSWDKDMGKNVKMWVVTKSVPCAIIYTSGNITTFAFLFLLLKSYFYPNSGWWYICTTAVVEAGLFRSFVSNTCVSSISK